MNVFQYIVRTILKKSGTKKFAIKRLARLGLTVSAESLRKRMKLVAEDFEKKIREWKSSVEGGLDNDLIYQIVGNNIDFEVRSRTLTKKQFMRVVLGRSPSVSVLLATRSSCG